MPKAVWRGATLAESDETIVVEGNHYFPPGSINLEYFVPTSHHTACPWKGQASYYTITVDGDKNENAAWYYPDPKAAAENIRDYVAFWHGVKVMQSGDSQQHEGAGSGDRTRWWQRLVPSAR